MLTVENNSVEYLVSKSILKELLKEKLITEDEFINIDLTNKNTAWTMTVQALNFLTFIICLHNLNYLL